jgi:hypothetical protein
MARDEVRCRIPKTRPREPSLSLTAKDNNNKRVRHTDSIIGPSSWRCNSPKTKKKFIVNNRIRENAHYDTLSNDELPLCEVIEQHLLGICCTICHCNEAQKNKYVTTSDDSLWHRCCCHNVVQSMDVNWLSPIEQVSVKIEDYWSNRTNHAISFLPSDYVKGRGKTINIIDKYNTAIKEQTKFRNQDNLPSMFFCLFLVCFNVFVLMSLF